MPLQSAYPGSDIETKDIGQILEEFIAANWGLIDSGLTVSDVGFGVAGTKMLKVQKNIVIRAFQIFSDIRDMVLGGHKNDYFELWWIDIYVRDAQTTTSRSPKLLKILRHVEHLFLENKTKLQEKGISSINCYKSTPIENPDSEDIYHCVIGLELRYITDLV
jgi:hypothetical protein